MNSLETRDYYESRSDYRRSQIKRRRVARRRMRATRTLVHVTAFVAVVAVIASLVLNAMSVAKSYFIEVNGRYYYLYNDEVAAAMTVAVNDKPDYNAVWLSVECSADIIRREDVFVAGSDPTQTDLEVEDLEEEEIELEEEPEVQEEPVETIEDAEPMLVTAEAPITESSEEMTMDIVNNNIANNYYYGYTAEDYQYLVMILVGECWQCEYNTQLAVGSVTLNILNNDKLFPNQNCIKDVALHRNQYSCFNDGNAYRTPNNINRMAAMELLRDGSIFPSNVIFQSAYVHGDGVYCQIGNILFCYKNI